MAAYLIAQIEVTDPQAYEAYKSQVPALIERYGGEYLVRGGALEVLEGDWAMPRTIILRFPSMEAARAWYTAADYQPVKALRRQASIGNVVLVDGM
ncbi:MAG: DUF1330 domain-containing protein [Rhodospirillaceae bacterium]|nr:DUF1330 domain-containing protein [Rhodospirillaceae bacterium]